MNVDIGLMEQKNKMEEDENYAAFRKDTSTSLSQFIF